MSRGGLPRRVLPALDARTRIAVLLVWTIAFFAMGNALVMAACVAAAVLLFLATGCSMALFARMSRGLFVMYAIIVAAGSVRAASGQETFSLWGLVLSGDAAMQATVACVRLYGVAVASLLVCASTGTSEMLGALRWLLSPLAALKAPVDDVVTMLTVALRTMPEASRRFEALRRAQNARGAAIGTQRNPLRRLLSYVPLFVPLLVALFRYADDQADALTMRGYRGHGYAARQNGSFGWFDGVVCIASVAGAVGLCVIP